MERGGSFRGSPVACRDHQDMTITEWLARVDALIETVVALRVALWEKAWAGGGHREAPPRPKRASQK